MMVLSMADAPFDAKCLIRHSDSLLIRHNYLHSHMQPLPVTAD